MRHLWLPVTLFLALLLLAAAPPSSNPPVSKNANRGGEENKSKTRSAKQRPKEQTESNAVPSPQESSEAHPARDVSKEQAPEGKQDRMWPPSPGWAAVYVAGVSALATIVYVFVSIAQWKAIRRQARIATEGVAVSKISAEAAGDSANVAKSSLRIAQRAWLSIAFDCAFRPRPEAVSPIQFRVRNIGQTPALVKEKRLNAITN